MICRTKEELNLISTRLCIAHKAGFEDGLEGTDGEMVWASVHELEAYTMGLARGAALRQAESERIG